MNPIQEAALAALASNGKTSMTFGWGLIDSLPKSECGWTYDQNAFQWIEKPPGNRKYPEDEM